MENASKALLIAGSILIAILLIAMAVKVVNPTKGLTDSAKITLDATEIAMFNNKFTPYFGTDKTKSDVMALCNVVVANNKISGKVITMIFVKESSVTTGNPTDIMTVASNLLSTKKYTIESLAISAEGYVQQIKITEQP